jgi:AcrR family transcriptional regulator
MAEIAAASEFAVGTLYKFFKDKNDLYQALLAETVHDYERQLVAALHGGGTELERIYRFIDIGSQLFVKHLPLARVYFSQTAAAFLFAAAGLEDESYLSYRRIVAALEEVIRGAVEKGYLVAVEPEVLAMGLEGVHNAFLASLVRDPNSYTPEQIADYTKQLFFGSVLRA